VLHTHLLMVSIHHYCWQQQCGHGQQCKRPMAAGGVVLHGAASLAAVAAAMMRSFWTVLAAVAAAAHCKRRHDVEA